jgi:hypothetical protein
MDKRGKLYHRLKKNPRNVRFTDVLNLANLVGFIHIGGKGSHRVMAQKNIKEILNFQRRKDGKAKDYQVEQLINIIDEYNLLEEE